MKLLELFNLRNKGFSFIELIIVISVVGMLISAVLPFGISFVRRRNLEMAIDVLLSMLRKAQAYSMAYKDSQSWGVCLKNRKIILFKEICKQSYFYETVDLPYGIKISGFSEIKFSVWRGEPSSQVTIKIVSGEEYKTLILNPVGGIRVGS